MRTFLILTATLASLISAEGTIFEFYLHGQGGYGLRGDNQVPPNSSPARGDEVNSGLGQGITFDDSNDILTISVGYGSDYNFTDLLGNYQAARLLGPAEEYGTSSKLVLDLRHIAGTTSPTHSGLIYGSKVLNSAQRGQLFEGLLYLDVRSDRSSDGELRANLVPIPEPAHYMAVAGVALVAFGAIRRQTPARG